MKRVLLSLLPLLLPAAAAQAEEVPVRAGDHPGFGRIVFDFTAPTGFDMAEQGDRVLLVFAGAPVIGTPDATPRNVRSFSGGTGAATVVLVHGARPRPVRMGARVVLDVLDPPAQRSRTPPQAAAAVPLMTRDAAAPAIPAPPHQAPPEPSPPETVAPEEPVPTASGHRDDPPAETVLHVPADDGVGAASFRRGDLALVVLDRRLPPAPGLADIEGFQFAEWRNLGDTTVIAVPSAAGEALRVTRDAAGWAVAHAPAGERQPVGQAASAEGMALKLDRAGHAVSIQDPVTGQALLVGTSLSGDGQAVLSGRSAPFYRLWPTWLGVVVEPSSDRVDLRATSSGFVLVAPEPGPVLAARAPGATRQFDFAADPTPVLTRRLQAQIAGAASLPPRARGPERVAAAQTMLALGLAPEAQALLALAAVDDPAVAGDPMVAGLAAVAAVLAGRPSEAAGLDEARLDGTDEVALWRGVRDAALGKPADGLGRQLALVMTYPDALQRSLLPAVAEAAVRAGLPLPENAAPNFARAMEQERKGPPDAAIAAYDAIVAGRDQRDAVRAAIRGTELRLAAGGMTPAAAADVLERQAYAWRGDKQEMTTRLRVAELRTQSGNWRAALDGLRDTEALFPDLKPDIKLRKAEVFRALLSSPPDKVRPLDLVGLAADYADCMPDGPAGEALSGLLADKLMALDLPSRAAPVLRSLMLASSGPARAGFGTRLAQLQLDSGEPATAEATLADSASAGLSPEATDSRALIQAQARAAQGDMAGAVAGLVAQGSPAADDLRAVLLGQGADWRGSLAALTDLAAKTIPPDGPLSDQQQTTLLRQASAAARAGDAGVLLALARQDVRLTGPRIDVFRALTAAPVQSPTDLPRAGREIALARAIPERTQALTRR